MSRQGSLKVCTRPTDSSPTGAAPRGGPGYWKWQFRPGNGRRIAFGASVALSCGLLISLTSAFREHGPRPIASALKNGGMLSLSRLSHNGQTGTSVITLRHSFGVVAPGREVKYRYAVRNTSRSRWTFSQIETKCACAVTRLSSPFIEPGTEETIELTYSPSGESRDETRRVVVYFAEKHAPLVELEAAAKIREPLTVSPASASLGQGGAGSVAEQSLDVHNYTDAAWADVRVASHHPWLTAVCSPVPVPESADGARQSWRLVVRADTKVLASGSHDGALTVAPEGGVDSLCKTVPVRVQVVTAVSPIPAQIFLRGAVPGMASEYKVALLLADNVSGLKTDDIHVRHDLGDALTISLSRASDRVWHLAARLQPPKLSAGKVLNGRIELSFADPALPSVSIPVSAWVSQP